MPVYHEYSKIKKEYEDFHKHLYSQGKLPMKNTDIGYWGVTPIEETFELFKRIGLHRSKNFLDLGSGDGRIVFLASIFGPTVHGIEFDPELTDISLNIKHNLSLNNDIKILNSDYLNHDLSSYDTIFISPDKPFNRDKLLVKLRTELKGSLIVHGWEFLPGLPLKKEEIINGEKFTIY